MSSITRTRARLTALLATLVVAITTVIAGPAVAAETASAGSSAASHAGRAYAVSALSGSSFQPGYIIDDANFYGTGAMSAAQIQAFLESKVKCTNSNCLPLLYTKTENRAADRNICGAYNTDSDGIERASTIIYKVQQVCGISARVLLVTLQKEQGLIGKPAPTTGQLRAAMGYRCPDTAPCSSSAAGFFRQIYGAAWQFKRYNHPDLWGNYHIGTYAIQYSPTKSCGTKTVKIRNHATAALYNYTPYTPNAGSLANLRGTTPSCGAYGNRNFWVFYNDWFGSPLAGAGEGAITAAYTEFGGATSSLGAKVTTTKCALTAMSCSKTYEHGVIFWSAASGAYVVAGAIGDFYKAQGGTKSALGLPSKNAVAMNGGANGNGVNQPFTGGLVSSSSAGTFAMLGAYRTKHAALEGVAGPMGWPTANRVCTLAAKACMQTFQNGTLASANSTAIAYAVVDPTIVAYYATQGGPTGVLGIPTRDAVPTSGGANGDGLNQPFVGGLISSSADGAYAMLGGLRTAHATRGGVAGKLGWPIANRTCGLPGGFCSQAFQHGTLYASAKVSGAVSVPEIATYYTGKGGPGGSLGLPKQDAVPMAGGANGAGFNQPFTNALVSSSANGTFSMVGLIRTAHGKLGGVAGPLGWPLGDQTCGLPKSGCKQVFQNGTIYASGTTAFSVSYAPISTYYDAAGGAAGALGYPTRERVAMKGGANGDGWNQPFQFGLVSSSAAGTFSMVGGFRTKHAELGGIAGRLGWPTADRTCGLANNGCSQTFQHGTITIDSAGTRVTYS